MNKKLKRNLVYTNGILKVYQNYENSLISFKDLLFNLPSIEYFLPISTNNSTHINLNLTQYSLNIVDDHIFSYTKINKQYLNKIKNLFYNRSFLFLLTDNEVKILKNTEHKDKEIIKLEKKLNEIQQKEKIKNIIFKSSILDSIDYLLVHTEKNNLYLYDSNHYLKFNEYFPVERVDKDFQKLKDVEWIFQIGKVAISLKYKNKIYSGLYYNISNKNSSSYYISKDEILFEDFLYNIKTNKISFLKEDDISNLFKKISSSHKMNTESISLILNLFDKKFEKSINRNIKNIFLKYCLKKF